MSQVKTFYKAGLQPYPNLAQPVNVLRKNPVTNKYHIISSGFKYKQSGDPIIILRYPFPTTVISPTNTYAYTVEVPGKIDFDFKDTLSGEYHSAFGNTSLFPNSIPVDTGNVEHLNRLHVFPLRFLPFKFKLHTNKVSPTLIYRPQNELYAIGEEPFVADRTKPFFSQFYDGRNTFKIHMARISDIWFQGSDVWCDGNSLYNYFGSLKFFIEFTIPDTSNWKNPGNPNKDPWDVSISNLVFSSVYTNPAEW